MHDLERIGLFKEMPYVTIGTPYKPAIKELRSFVGKNFIVPGSKLPCGNVDGYFHEFQRTFDGEGNLVNYVDLLRKWRRNSDLKNLGKKWVPSSGGKMQCGVGDPSGCFTERRPAFSSVALSVPFVHEGKNFITNPGKKGTGYGYEDVCINKYPEYIQGNKYQDFQGIYKKLNEYHELKIAGRPVFKPPNGFGTYFTENPYIGGSPEVRPGKPVVEIKKPFIPASYPKRDGGMKAGTINPFPEYSHDTYIDKPYKYFKDYINKEGKKLLPNNCFPTYFPTSSILSKNVMFRCNNRNIGKLSKVMNY